MSKKREDQKNAEESIYDEFGRYINENRLDNLRSKIGEFTSEQINEVGKKLFDDAFEDFLLTKEMLWNEIQQDKHEILKKNFLSLATQFVSAFLTQKNKDSNET